VTTIARAGHAAARYRRVPWSPQAWRQALYLFGAIPAQLAGLAVPVAFAFWSRHWALWTWSVRVLHARQGLHPLWFAEAALVFLAVPALTGLHRQRLRATAGVGIPPQPVSRRLLSIRGIIAAVRSRATWRQLGYHLLAGPALAVAEVAVLGVWLAGVLYSLVYVYAWALPHSADAKAARRLLGPSRTEELEHRVEHLAQTRAGVVDAADAERRRLERDLHDGTQQRLVALAMNLGIAKAQATTAEQAQHAIEEAHEEAKAALVELRNLIRGLHPAVLEDRGLDAALSGVVARTPIPVRLNVDLTRRASPVIEAVAYFVVSEALTNVAKHAQASQAEVIVQGSGDRLHVIVSDDGVGGADPARGTGLAGLAKRATSVDGTFEITSPPGGPTLLTVDLPCAR
jgi:signal transduction histidine kinase